MKIIRRLAPVCLGVLLAGGVGAADEFYTSAFLDAEASNGTPFPVNDVANDGRSQEHLRLDSVVAIGPAGNSASLTSVANLATGTLAIWGASNNALDAGSGFYFGADATGIVELQDTLTVVLPAGFYPAPLEIVIDTVVDGRVATSSPLEIDNFVNGLVRWDLIFYNATAGGPNTVYENNTGFVSHGDALDVLDSITLSAELVPGGTTLTEATAYDFVLTASLWVIRNESFNPTTPNSSSIGFGSSLRFLSVDVPLDLGYASASGVFLSAIPLPPTAVLLLLPAGLLALRGRRSP